MKHVGKMVNNGAKVAVVYRTLPGDSGSALVVGTGSLPESWHDSMMSLLQDIGGQQANELADILSVRKFPDGSAMLESLHVHGHLKKVPTSGVMMIPSNNAQILLSELNQLIAEQKGVAVDQLAITDGVNPNPRTKKSADLSNTVDIKEDFTRTTSASINGEPAVVEEEDLSPTQMRSRADALFKQAQVLRKQADAIDPPKPKSKKIVEKTE
jgi:hypothetical protein